jgi:hypothetical protein
MFRLTVAHPARADWPVLAVGTEMAASISDRAELPQTAEGPKSASSHESAREQFTAATSRTLAHGAMSVGGGSGRQLGGSTRGDPTTSMRRALYPPTRRQRLGRRWEVERQVVRSARLQRALRDPWLQARTVKGRIMSLSSCSTIWQW